MKLGCSPICNDFPASECNRDFSISASVDTEALEYVCRQRIWSVPWDDNVSVLMGHYGMETTSSGIQKTFFIWRLISSCWSQAKKKALSIGLCGPSPLLRVTVKPPVAWPRGWEVLGRDCACGTKEAGFNPAVTWDSSAPQRFCVCINPNVFSGNDTSFCERSWFQTFVAVSSARPVPAKQLGLCLGYLIGLAPAQGTGKAGSHPGDQAAQSVKTIAGLLPTLPGEQCSLGSQAGCGSQAPGEGRQQLLLKCCLEEQQPLLCPAPAHCLKHRHTNPCPKGYFSQFCCLPPPTVFLW